MTIAFFRPNGNIFTVPFEDNQVANLKMGDVVTFAFENSLRRGVPLNPKIVKLRNDISWQDVIRSYKKDTAYLNGNYNPFCVREPACACACECVRVCVCVCMCVCMYVWCEGKMVATSF